MKSLGGLFGPPFRQWVSRRSLQTKIQEVGKLGSLKTTGDYIAGQSFLHKVFGYRGVVLFPWKAKVYDRTRSSSKQRKERGKGSSGFDDTKTVHPHTFYQVLIDPRDYPHIRTQTEAVTFLGTDEGNRSLYAIPGLDYVPHDDILPYLPTEKKAIHHELFDKFFKHEPKKDPPYVPQDSLKSWAKKSHPWLELSDVYRETTENIRVTVIPFFMGSRSSSSSGEMFWWRYSVRLENFGHSTVHLRERHWRIFSLNGTLKTVRGRGVVGQEPVLSRRSPAYQYSSHVSLQSPGGHMWGTYRMEREDGSAFDCKIPPFSLESGPW